MVGRGLPVLRVKVKLIRRQRLAVGAVVDVEVEGVGLDRAFVGHRDARVFLKRHREKTIQRLVGPDRQRNRLIKVIVAEPQPEEVADRRFDAGRRFPVPVHAQHQRLQMIRIVARNRDPDMRDQAGPGVVQQRERLSRSDGARIRIPAAAVITGGAVLHIVLGLRKSREPGRRILREPNMQADQKSCRRIRHVSHGN